ncbi:MAG: hypothetical protein KA271_00755 [Propionivibrio sp.]|nr:hypothetical protein [Propionivibrio sp.]
MTSFLKLLREQDKGLALLEAAQSIRNSLADGRTFDVKPEEFRKIPGAPFSYWVTDKVRDSFTRIPAFSDGHRVARQGLATADDARFVRLYWEVDSGDIDHWRPFSKGGAFSRYYGSLHLVVDWHKGQKQMWAITNPTSGKPKSNIWMLPETINSYFFRPGFTWSRRSAKGLSFRALPVDCVFSDKGPTVFCDRNDSTELLSLMAIANSSVFELLVSLQMAVGSYEAGVVLRTPVPTLTPDQENRLAYLSWKAWSLKRSLDSTSETSHAFEVPQILRLRLQDHDAEKIEAQLLDIQLEIDNTAFTLFGFTDTDREVMTESSPVSDDLDTIDADVEDEDFSAEAPTDIQSALLSWCLGVAFGRFDWRLATGERAAPPEPKPFDPLPAKSPGMLPDGTAPFHIHAGILVDDQGHPHDLAHLVEEVLGRVDMPVPDDVRRWLQRDFFAFHLQRYSKSRRKAPIYWPLATASGSYTLWLYYPSLSSQTLYTAINDFVEPKLNEVGAGGTALRNKGSARTRDEEKQFEILQAFELELIELRDTLLRIAQGYQPNHDDGVQITAAPLWPLFRHKPWQKVLKDTWAKLEKGDYDWAHLAMNYWPARVREKCKTDKSLAIAHDLEALYVEPEAKPKKTRAAKGAGK